jgi:hypothetical protein
MLVPDAKAEISIQERWPRFVTAAKVRNARINSGRCHYRKSDPNVLMMQSSEERHRGDLPDALNGSGDRRILFQHQVGPHVVVVGGVCPNDANASALRRTPRCGRATVVELCRLTGPRSAIS